MYACGNMELWSDAKPQRLIICKASNDSIYDTTLTYPAYQLYSDVQLLTRNSLPYRSSGPHPHASQIGASAIFLHCPVSLADLAAGTP